MAKTLEDVIYDRLIDLIQNGAKDNDLRDAYDEFMSDRNYNNNDMKALFDHTLKMVELDWENCRNDREEDKLIESCCDDGVAQGIAVWVIGDKKLANAIDDDRVWRDLQTSARDWDKVEDDYDRATRNTRGGGRDRGGRDDRRDRGGRDNDRNSRNTGIGYTQSRPPTGRSDREDRGSRRGGGRDDSRMTGGFGGGRDKPRESARNAEEPRDTRTSRNSSPLARGARTQETREVEHEPRLHRHSEPAADVIEDNAGPDFSKERPFDSFWDNGENWQLAHVSDLEWTWTPKQMFCRSYDPDQEVRFLVKGKDGKVREEFLPVSDDLSSAAHEIKALKRPNDERRTRDSGGGAIGAEISLPGSDLDTVDLDKLTGQVDQARLTLITEMDLNSVEVDQGQVVASTVRDGLIKATSLRLQTGKSIAAAQNMIVEILPSTGKGTAELESLSNLIGSDGGLDILQKRLAGLRGKVDESVLDHIDRHYTEEVNHSLKYAFGFAGKLEVGSFIDDFADMLEVMTAHRNAGFTAQYLARTRNLVPTLVVLKEADGRKDVIASQDLLPEAEEDSAAYIAYRENVVVILKPSASLSVNVDLEAFGMVDTDPRVAQGSGAGADPELRDALNGLYLIARKSSAPGRVHVVTADNIVLELVGMAGARDVVGVRRA